MFVSLSRILLLIAVLLSVQVRAQPALDAAAQRQRELVAEVEEIQSQQGPSAAELIAPLTALALFYEENGDLVPAVAMIDRVLAVIRVNYGLHSLEQIPMTMRLVDIAEARGDIATAWALEEQLIELAERNPDDRRAVAVWKHFRDQRMDMLERYVAGELPPRMAFGCYHDNQTRLSGCLAGSRADAARAMLNEVHDYYNNAIDVLTRMDQYDAEELEQLEMELVVSSFRYGKFLRARDGASRPKEGTNGCERGLDSLERLHEYNNRNPTGTEERVRSLLRIADAQLVCRQHASASKTYEQAWMLAQQEGLERSAIERIFSPAQPVALPTFLPHPLAVVEPRDSDDGVAVEFELTRYGLSRRIDIPEGRRAENAGDVRRLVRGQLFRPYISDGKVQPSPRYSVRYTVDTHSRPQFEPIESP